MKKLILSLAMVFIATGALSNLSAAARNPSNLSREYIVGTSDLSRWLCGVYGDQWERELRVADAGMAGTVKSAKFMGYVGYDVLPWLNAYVAAGESELGMRGSGDGAVAVGGGLQFSIIDVDIPDPGLMEDRLRLNASLEGTYTSTDFMDDSISWYEIYADLTVALVNDTFDATVVSLEGIALFTGPFYSTLISDDLEGSEKQQVGWAVGAEIFITKRVSLNARYLAADAAGFSAGINVRF